MKKVKILKLSPPDGDKLPEYDFSGKLGVRGKYYQAYQQGHTVRVYQDDGSVTVQYFTLEDGAMMLEPEVREYFPDSESVNRALRSLIALIPDKPTRNAAASKRQKHKAKF
jgi:hypothetical protein